MEGPIDSLGAICKLSNTTRLSTFFINGQGIEREVITTNICRYLGNDALVRPGTHMDSNTGKAQEGFYITAYRPPTWQELQDLRSDSTKWQEEKRRHVNSMARQGQGHEMRVLEQPQVYDQMSYVALDRPPGGYPEQSPLPSQGRSRPTARTSQDYQIRNYYNMQQPMPAGLRYGYSNQDFSSQIPPQSVSVAGLGYGYRSDVARQKSLPAGLAYYGGTSNQPVPAGIEYHRESNYYSPPPLRSESSSQPAKMSSGALTTSYSKRTGNPAPTEVATEPAGIYPSQNPVAPSGYTVRSRDSQGLFTESLGATSRNVTGERNVTNNNYSQEPPPGYGEEEYYNDEELELYDDPYALEKKDRAQE